MKLLTFEKDFVWPFNLEFINSVVPKILILQIINLCLIGLVFISSNAFLRWNKQNISLTIFIALITFFIQIGVIIIEIQGLESIYKGQKYKMPSMNFLLKKGINLSLTTIIPLTIISLIVLLLSYLIFNFIKSGLIVLAVLSFVVTLFLLIYLSKAFQFIYIEATINNNGPLTSFRNAVILSREKGSWGIFFENILVGIFYSFVTSILSPFSELIASNLYLAILLGSCTFILLFCSFIHPLSVLVKGYNKLVSSHTK